MKFSELSKKTKLTIIVYSLLGLMIAVFAVGVYLTQEDNKELLAKGVKAEASVVDVYMQISGTRKNKNYRYYMDIAFFESLDKVKVQPKSDDIVDKVAAISEEAVANAKLGDYHSSRITISKYSYEKYRKGDKVMVIYMKDKPEEAKLLSEVQ
ncbi:MAG: DUF3592 domain-containing protein [Spirosomataceae bacterium]